MIKNKIFQNIFTVLIILLMVIVGTRSNKKKEAYNDYLLKYGNYSIGQITEFQKEKNLILGFSNGKAAKITFDVEIDGKMYTCSYDAWKFYIPSRNIKKGDKFLALYPTSKNIDSCMIKFDYPINDSLDFNNHINEIEKLR